jgi:hypothetical protein
MDDTSLWRAALDESDDEVERLASFAGAVEEFDATEAADTL